MRGAVSDTMEAAWGFRLGGQLTQPVAVGGLLYTARKDAHTLYAVDVESGRVDPSGERQVKSPTRGGRPDL